jgi:hypothetical protein
MAGTSTALFDTLNMFATELEGEKRAASNTEAGGRDGATTHPSGNVEDHTENATEGSRSAENSSDIKGDRDGPRVDEVSEGTDGVDQDSQQLNIGTNQAATGEDTSVERDFKDSKDETGGHHGTTTSHPAKAGVDDAAKFGSWGFSKLAAHCVTAGNEILAAIAVGGGPAAQKAAAVTANKAAPAGAAPTEAEKAAAAGYDFATLLGTPGVSDDERAEGFIEATIKEAHAHADLVGGYLRELQKSAMDPSGGEEEGEDHNREGDDASGANDAGAADGGDGGGGEGPPPEGGEAPEAGGDILGDMGAGGDPLAGLGGEPEGGDPAMGGAPPMGGGDPMMGGGGDPMMGGGGDPMMGGGDPMMGGGDPMMGGGAPPMGGDPMGAPGGDDALQQLAAALMELGINPEELMAAGGKMAADTSAVLKERGAKLTKVASAVQMFKRAGKFNFGETKSAAERQLRDRMKAYVREATSLV